MCLKWVIGTTIVISETVRDTTSVKLVVVPFFEENRAYDGPFMLTCSKTQDLTIYCFRNSAIILAILLLCVIIFSVMLQFFYEEVDEHNYDYVEHNYGELLGTHKVYYRKDWGGECPKYNTTPLEHPVSLVIISHTATLSCNISNECFSLLRDLQKKHFAYPTHTVDIGYNFLIGGDGNIYVGRGWDIKNFHRKPSVGISFIGNFNYDTLNPNMIDAAQEVIKEGLELKKIARDYILVGENQTSSLQYLSPGKNTYKVIVNWPHFYNKTML